MKDRVYYVPFLCLIFLVGLILLGQLPDIKIFGYEVKTLKMFSDIQKEENTENLLVDIPIVEPVKEPECPEGQVCVEDYSENKNMLTKLFSALDSIQRDKKVRIAFFGDSFIEGDVLCGDFRDILQSNFGGTGVGYLPVTSSVSMFRQTIKEEFKNFKSFDAIHNPKEKVSYPPYGELAIPEKGNYAQYYTTNFSEKTNRLPQARLFYQSDKDTEATITTDIGTQKVKLPKAAVFNSVPVDYEPSRKVRISFRENKKTYLYGVSFEGEAGVYVDNFSLRGNSGSTLLVSDLKMHEALNKEQNYKLIILQYGTNAVNEKTKKFDWYISIMNRVIKNIKETYPDAAILLLGVADRSYKQQGEYKTMPTIKAMVEVQRSIAANNNIVFWDMYQAMGGEGSMFNFVKDKKANMDYTHLNFLGGKEIAELLYKSLMFEYDKHEKR